MRLAADFYARPVLEVAHDLIGCIVEHRGVSGRIVETEAYHESEPASHAFVGLTPRTRTLFGDPGIAYVYRSYGIHALLNAVCEPAGVGAGVLIRALEPLDGIEEMRSRRERARAPDGSSGSRIVRAPLRDRDLCSGPGKLTQALGVGMSENGSSLLDGPIAIRFDYAAGRFAPVFGRHRVRDVRGAPDGALGPDRAREETGDRATSESGVVVGTRIGITKAVELRWRFCAADNPYVSIRPPTQRPSTHR